jgi:hypothetical protein
MISWFDVFLLAKDLNDAEDTFLQSYSADVSLINPQKTNQQQMQRHRANCYI